MDSSTAKDPAQSNASLPFVELNHDAPTTILFIHGAGDTGRSWDQVVSYLPNYHTLLPDLPGHGAAVDRFPDFSVSASVQLLAKIIRSHGKNGKARVVGLSMGARVGVELISEHSGLIDNAAFLTGYGVFPDINPGMMASFFWLESRVPKSFVGWLSDSKDIPETRPPSYAWWRNMSGIVTTENWPEPWPARTMIVAAGKKIGMIPIADPPECAIKLRDIGRKVNPATMAYTHPEMRHAWHFQDPQLFATTVQAWFEEKPLPAGFKAL